VDKQEARQILDEEVRKLRRRSYADLRDSLLSAPNTFEVKGASGTLYQVETQAHWDRGKDGPLRLFVSVDDGGWRAVVPMSQSFILAPEGSFVDE
jgi:hypothetical protein